MPASWAAWLVVVASGWALRSRAYAIYRAVTLGLQVLIASALVRYFAWAFPAVAYLEAMVFLSSLVLIRPHLRGLPYRALVSVPAAFFGAGTLLAAPWAVVAAFGFTPHGAWIPYLFAAVGIVPGFRPSAHPATAAPTMTETAKEKRRTIGSVEAMVISRMY